MSEQTTPSDRPKACLPRLRPVEPAACADDSVRDDRGSADLRAVDRQFPAQLAERPAGRRAHRRAGARGRAERHGARIAGAPDPAKHRRPRGGDEDGFAAPPAGRSPKCRPTIQQDIDMRNVSWFRAIVDAFDAMLIERRARRDPRGRAGADGRRLSRDRAGRGAAAPGHAALLGQHPAAVADHLRHHRDAGLFRAALPAGAADAPDHRQHDGVPRRSGKPVARDRRPRSGRTRSGWPSANSPRCSAISTSMLHQKSRLAALGLAVSKINHDLRNLLTSAQLFSEGLSSLPDPRVQRFAPKLMRALERAIEFCQSTLSYGRAQEPPPERRPVALEAAGRGCARDARPRRSDVDRLDRRDRARPDRRCRPRPVAARAAQPRAQRGAGAGNARARTIRCATRSASPGGARARWW